MAGFLWLAVLHARRGDARLAVTVPKAVDVGRLRQLVGLGLPAATQVTLEVGAFTLATALAAKLDAVSSASHQIALNIVGLAYMVPLGLSSAAAVRVGHAVGARDRVRAISAGWLAIGVGCAMAILLAFMMLASARTERN